MASSSASAGCIVAAHNNPTPSAEPAAAKTDGEDPRAAFADENERLVAKHRFAAVLVTRLLHLPTVRRSTPSADAPRMVFNLPSPDQWQERA